MTYRLDPWEKYECWYRTAIADLERRFYRVLDLLEKANFSPGQLRAPSGQPGGGQWTGGGGDGDVHLVGGGTGKPVDLLHEEGRGGHTVKKHVGKSESFLLNRVLTEVYRVGMFTYGLEAAGTFPSLNAANSLVNSTLADNALIVRKVASGELGGARLEKEFASLTGIEAYRKNDRTSPYIRDTTAVEVLIKHDPSSPNGFLIVTAYPKNRRN